MLTRTIPKSGEKLPVVGLGTWQTFDVGPSPGDRKDQKEVLKRFLAAGARVIDSSPMYGRAETVVGDLLRELGEERTPFLATKVWTSGREAGVELMRDSLRKMGHGQLELMQVHNLVDVRTHLATLREWKKAGRIRYLGVMGCLGRRVRQEAAPPLHRPGAQPERHPSAALLHPSALVFAFNRPSILLMLNH